MKVRWLVWLAVWMLPRCVSACVGSACLQIWSTEPNGGALAIEYGFDRPVPTYETFCTPDRALCLFSAIDPGFIATLEDTAVDQFYPLVEGTAVRLEVLAVESGFTWRINGQSVGAGQSAALGVMPEIHVHPSWQIEARDDVRGEYRVRFRLRSESSRYQDSAEYSLVVTNAEPVAEGTATPTATATATPGVVACVGDCSADRQVTVDEIVRGVAIALGTEPIAACRRFDGNDDGAVSVDEIVTAIRGALEGCDSPPLVEFESLQATIFTPRCATLFCHDSRSRVGDLDLSAARAYAELVGVAPDIESARAAGLLRVRAGDPESSFLWIKVTSPPLVFGSRMPLVGAPLTDSDLERLRRWIRDGATR